MKKTPIISTIVITGLFGLGLAAWALQRGPMESPMRGREPGDRSARLLTLLESDRVKTELGLSDEQSQRLRQIVVDTEKSSIKTRADLAVRGIELRELLRADNPDRDAATKKVQEISNLRGELMKQRVEASLAARKVLTPEQQKKLRTFIEMRRSAAFRRGGMMERQPRPAPGPPPEPGSMPKPLAQ